MARRMGWREAAAALQLTENAMYSAIRQGILPAWRIGSPGKRGKLIVDVDLCEQVIKEKMLENIRNTEPEQPYTTIRKVK